MSQIDDMVALNDYFNRVIAITPEAVKHKAAWYTWYNGLGAIEKRMSNAVWDQARARRNEFNLANAKTPSEKAQVEYVMATGTTTESLAGKPAAVVQAKRDEIKQMGAQIKQQVTNAGAVYPTLRRGSKGEAVKRWQSIVFMPADGNFGSGTEAATKKFQAGKGLTADGVVGPKTWSAATGAPAQTVVPPEPKGVLETIVEAVLPAPKPPTTVVSQVKPPSASAPRPPMPRPPTASTPRPPTASAPRPPTAGPSPKPTTVPAAPPPAAYVSPSTTASMIGGFNKVPTWAKFVGAGILGALGLVGVKVIKDMEERY